MPVQAGGGTGTLKWLSASVHSQFTHRTAPPDDDAPTQQRSGVPAGGEQVPQTPWLAPIDASSQSANQALGLSRGSAVLPPRGSARGGSSLYRWM